MKGAIVGFVITFVLVFTIFITQGTSAESVHKDELTMNTSSAVSFVLDNAKKAKYNSNEEMANDFNNNLKEMMGSDAKVHVDILDIDWKEGVLAVKTTEEFKLPNGTKKTVVCTKTGLMEKEAKN